MFAFSNHPLTLRALGLSAALLLSACAQTDAAHDHVKYEPKRGSTESDAQHNARGRVASTPPSQLQLGFGGDSKTAPLTADQAVIQARQARELNETRTFLGTIPCANDDLQCSPLRVTLTLAPSQQWRIRAQPLNNVDKSYATAGCWYVTGQEPTRIILQNTPDNVLGEFRFLNNRQMKVISFNHRQPTLETILSAQADLDAINELDDSVAPNCSTL